MKQTQTFISTYTADVSGVCSALYELGGMAVMHDASGCNSTYNTHDEPRWYDSKSLVFISGLSEMEAIMGDDEKLISDIVEAANELHPRFIAIAGTPIPMMTGCDIPAIASVIEAQTGIPSFGFQTNGMHSYVDGASMALAEYAMRMTDPCSKPDAKNKINILGATPLDFALNGSVCDMKKLLVENGWNVVSTWAMGSTPEELYLAGSANINLVVSSVGLAAARVLKEKYGTPYVIGTPTGEMFNEKLLKTLEETADGNDRVVFSDYHSSSDSEIIIIGESITSRSLANAVFLEYGKNARVICPIETENGILSENDFIESGETEISEILKTTKAVIADPLYKPIVPNSCAFFPLPHVAFSGRLYLNSIPNTVNKI